MMLFKISNQYDSYLHLLLSPNENGFLTFLLGALFILSIYHSILFIQNNDKSYLYYALYTVLLFITYGSFLNKNNFLGFLLEWCSDYTRDYKLLFIWLYNTVYFSFGVTFINLKEHNYKWYKIILVGVYSLFFLGCGIQLIADVTHNPMLFKKVYLFIFLPVISLFSLLSFWVILKVKSYLKYYLVIGSAILLFSSLVATLIVDVGVIKNIYGLGTLIFYIGLIIENIFFSIGLGYKQKLVLLEKNKALSTVLEGYKQNQQLKKELNIELNEKIRILEAKIKSDIENNELKLTILKSQINPHFIFNSLNTLKFLIIKNDLDNAVLYLVKFSGLLRSVLENSVKNLISLEEEIAFLKLYIFLENLRFNDAIDFTCTIDDHIDIYNFYLPPLILQPIIENSIWHGLTPLKRKKQLHVNFTYINSKKICITIQDNGVGRDLTKKSLHKKSFGIQLTKERLQTFDKASSFEVIDLLDEKGNPAGTKTNIEIHKLKSDL